LARIRIQFSSVALCYESAQDFVFILCMAYQIPKPQQALTVNKVWAQFSLSFCLEKLLLRFACEDLEFGFSQYYEFSILMYWIAVRNAIGNQTPCTRTTLIISQSFCIIYINQLPAKAISHWNSFSEKMNFKVQKNCANMVKIPSSVSFHQYFQVFYMDINICFGNLVFV